MWIQSLFPFRYFSSVPAPTKPALLPRPPLKGESLKSRPLDFNSQEGPVVLSPPRKSRRVMLNREGLEGNHQVMNMGGVRQMGETTSHSSHVPMSVDLADLFERRSPPRPTLNRLVIFTQKKGFVISNLDWMQVLQAHLFMFVGRKWSGVFVFWWIRWLKPATLWVRQRKPFNCPEGSCRPGVSCICQLLWISSIDRWLIIFFNCPLWRSHPGAPIRKKWLGD